jgi:hypothetical protein
MLAVLAPALSWMWQVHAAAAEHLVSLMSRSFTLTLNMATLLAIAIALIVASFYVIRYHVLARYSRLPALNKELPAEEEAKKGITVIAGMDGVMLIMLCNP